MTEEQLKELFTPEEYNQFCEFMIGMDYSWSNDFCYIEHIQEFLTILPDDTRKEDIIYSCIKNYPHVLGLEAEK